MTDDNERRTPFGPNVWLIDEMHREFLEHPERLSESWREFFSDYRPPTTRGVAVPPPAAAPSVPATRVPAPTPAPPEAVPLRGPAARIVENMEASLTVPTATSVRTVAVKLLEENRVILNQHLADTQGGRVSFTHLLAWAVVKALGLMPALRTVFAAIDGVPHKVTPPHLNLGLAVDLQRKDGTRSLVVPNLKAVETLDFAAFFAVYNDLLRKVHANQLTPDDFTDTHVTLTNPGTVGTTQSVPRLMRAQSAIIGTGAIGVPAEYQFADSETLARLGIGRVMTLTCTYDHRVIQGAESGAFLALIADLLAGEHEFYREIFASLGVPHAPLKLARDINPYRGDGARGTIEKQAGVLGLVNMHRVRGHLVAHLNPLGSEMPTHPELDLAHHGLTIWDLDREFAAGGLGGRASASLRDILATLQRAYCDTIGVEYMFIQEPDQKAWIQERVEGVERAQWLDTTEKRRILEGLNAAEAFERFLHTKYLGHKRFSLEGAETLIPMLDRVLTRGSAAGAREAVIGMAHRGRLNVLVNVIGKSVEAIFREFEGNLDPTSRDGTGDVKYHLGATGTYTSPAGGTLRLTLAANPSHLEAVGPVVEGMARALQDARGDAAHEHVLPILIHGDAAFAGQGVVAETLNMSALSGFRTGGTVHVVVNNGIGFTTAPADARSSVYATDVAKMVQAPIFHVNGDDPEAAAHVMDVAVSFQRAFKKDVVVDVICYRRHGHNEADEPAYTQPLMYEKIRAHRSVRKLYTERLVNRGDLTLAEAEAALKDFQDRLEAAFAATRESAPPDVCLFPDGALPAGKPASSPAVSRVRLDEIIAKMSALPTDFHLHPKLARLLAARREMLAKDAVDWGTAELLAFGSLLLEGKPVRLSGQDTRRGTFSQRHAVLVDQGSGADYTPLQHLAPDQAPFLIYDSLLSEYAVLAFEYGYSVARPEALVAWEAQFGDFANGAQIIIDQFIAAAEEKWRQPSRLTLLLPHGHEGQGPEHSSARIERFLQLAARGNMRIAIPSTAAQHFHLLRTQAHLEHAKPLVVFTPKSLLRADAAKSRADEFTDGSWYPLLADPAPPVQPLRLVLCSGKVSHDLFSHRATLDSSRVMVARVEQLFPFPADEVRALLDAMPSATEVRWVQEEPHNMGAWSFVAPLLRELLGDRRLTYVGRAAAGSPATGSARVHEAEQERLVVHAFRE